MVRVTETPSSRLVIIIGAGPAGLATAACLSVLSIPFIVLEREDCIASLWRHRAYDRLKLHLAKRFCQLPYMPHHADAPTYIPKDMFIKYLDEYAARFDVQPQFGADVVSASYEDGKWVVKAKMEEGGDEEVHVGGFLVIATGENGEPFVPKIAGMEGYSGNVLHSVEYKNGEIYEGKSVLVVGSGNSGMEIAYDLSNYGALTSISVRSEFHVATKEIIYLGMVLLAWKVPASLVDMILVFLSKLKYGDLTKYGIVRPKEGPFFLKATKGKSSVIDVGTIQKIKTGEIQVLPGISSIEGNSVKFTNGASHYFDAILFATGYRSVANKWLKDEGHHYLNEKGLPVRSFPDHWKGKNGIYSVGLARRGLDGVASDARNIANDICSILNSKNTL